MNTSKAKTYIISAVSFAVMLAVSLLILGNLLEPISQSFYFNHDMQEIKDNDENVEMIFVGASRTARSFIPAIFEEEMGLDCVINAASSSQNIWGSYYQLKELLKDHHPRYVVLGVVENTLRSGLVQADLIVSDRLSGLNKLSFYWNCFTGTDKLYALRAYRFRDNLAKIKENRQQKAEAIARGYKDDSSQDMYYDDTGYICSNRSYKTGTIPIVTKKGFSLDLVRPKQLSYLEKIVQLCQEKGIRLFLVSGITTDMRLYCIDNYQGAVDWYHEFAKENGLVYHNLNYLMDREELFPDEMMSDYNHLNVQGAEIASRLYAQVLRKELKGENTDDMFYKDLEDLKKTVHRIVAVDADISFDPSDPSKATAKISSYQNEDVTPLYQIEVKYKDGSKETVVPWTADNEVSFLLKEKKGYTVTVRAKADRDDYLQAYQRYKY